jgi:DMSO/TMAO reductase YedYZ molybdopterin-dependent catalytic subunit
MKRAGVLAAALLGFSVVANAGAALDAAPGIAVDGHAEHALRLTIDDLKALPQSAVDVTFTTGHGPQSGHFTGVLLWDVIQKAGIVDEAGAKTKHHLQHALLVVGRDGYAVVVSLGEIDPEFEGKTVLLTDDNAAEGVRLVVPGDKAGGRNVRDVVRIEIE